MPIKGLTDIARPAFPRVGKLRKGGEKGINRPGPDLKYWRFTSPNPAIEEAFAEAYGPEPHELDVLLPYAAIADNFSTWKEHWLAGGLQHRCDGETCTVWLTPQGTYSRAPEICPGGCKEIGRLEVILPSLLRAGFVGYVTMETGSLNDIIAIQSALLATKETRGHEDMRGILFVLRRVEETISTPGTGGKRVRRKKWLVKLEPAARWVRAQLEAAQHRAMLPMDIRTGEIVDSVAREVPEEASIEPPVRSEAEQPKGVHVPQTEKPKQRSAGEERQAIAFSKMIYMRWDPMFPEDKDHDIFHKQFGVESAKALSGVVSSERIMALLNIVDLGFQRSLKLDEILAALGVARLRDWLIGGELYDEGVEMIGDYLDNHAGQQEPKDESLSEQAGIPF